MKPFYKHHYDKVTMPISVSLADIADYMDDGDADVLENMGVFKVGATLTVHRENEDKESGVPVSYALDDIDVDIENLHPFYKDKVIRAVEDYVYTNEDDYLSGNRVIDAFAYMDERRKEVA